MTMTQDILFWITEIADWVMVVSGSGALLLFVIGFVVAVVNAAIETRKAWNARHIR
jgi:hypothetical protein